VYITSYVKCVVTED